jgi:transcriptional/translational regulatory protein YebC/TACO1
MFTKKGLITVNAANANEEQLLEIALSAGADDMQAVREVFEITCEPGVYEELKKTLQEKVIPIEIAEISMVPQTTIDISNEHIAKRIISLMEAFEDHDDVQNTYANFDIPEEIITQIS